MSGILATAGCVLLLSLALWPRSHKPIKRDDEEAPGRPWCAPGTEGKR